MAMQIDRQPRKTGIEVVGEVPWGTHFFMFYETKEDLLDTLVPYFKAGLETGELCLWVVSEPLTEEEAREALREAVIEFDRYLEDHSIEILRGRQFYLSGNDPNLGHVIRTWIEKTNSAVTRGYAGFRMSASTSWLERKNWKTFCDYESEVNHSISNWRMMALCTYPLAGSTAAEIFDVIHTHQFAIARRNRSWDVVETSELKQAKSEIKRLNNELEQRVIDRTRQLAAVNEDMRREMIERQRAEDALQAAQAELAHVTRALTMGEMVASIAHEVYQPLTAVVTTSNFVRRQLAKPSPNLAEVQDAIREIVEDANRVSMVISRVRAMFTRNAADRVALNINDVIQEVTVLVRNEAARNRVQIRLDLTSGLPRILGDSVQLQQVLINLIMNGLDAMCIVADRPRNLNIQSAKHADGVLVRVQDSGIGLHPNSAEHIFEPFFTTKPQGIGMGLSISRSIVESHGGRLWAEPVSTGAIFHFVIPSTEGSIS